MALTRAEVPLMNEEPSEHGKTPNTWEVILSVLAAGLGVQNSKNRKRDFENGNPVVFILAGLLFTVLFVLTLILVVNLVL